MTEELKGVLDRLSRLDAPAMGIILAETDIAIRLYDAYNNKAQEEEARESGDAQ